MRTSTISACLLGLTLAACAGQSGPADDATDAAASTPSPFAVREPVCAPEAAKPGELDGLKPALESVDDGDLEAAQEELRSLLEREPQNVTAHALLLAVDEGYRRQAEEAHSLLDGIEPHTLPKLSGALAKDEGGVVKRVTVGKSAVPQLTVKEGANEEIPETEETKGFAPDMMGPGSITEHIDWGDHRILVYGYTQVLVVDDKDEIRRALDFSAINAKAADGIEVRHAQVVDGILYCLVSSRFRSSAEESKTGYVMAIDLKDNSVRWRSARAIADSHVLLVHGDHLLVGEPNYMDGGGSVHVLSRADGSKLSSVTVAPTPMFLRMRGSEIVVGAYGEGVALARTGPAPAATKANLTGVPKTGVILSTSALAPPPPRERDKCFRDNAIVMMVRGDALGASKQLNRISDQGRVNPATRALVRHVRAIAQTGRQSFPAPIAVQPDAGASHPAIASTAAPVFEPKDPTELGNDRTIPDGPEGIIHMGGGFGSGFVMVNQLPVSIPTDLAGTSADMAIEHDLAWSLLFDAGRYVAVVSKRDAAMTVFDFAELKGDDHGVTWVALADGVLYATLGGHRMTGVAKAIAVSLTDGKVIWQSDTDVCNSQNFLVHGSHLVCGYAGEESSLTVLSRLDGTTVSRLPLELQPQYIAQEGGRLLLRGDMKDQTFTIK